LINATKDENTYVFPGSQANTEDETKTYELENEKGDNVRNKGMVENDKPNNNVLTRGEQDIGFRCAVSAP
jgi:hypothetical protein